MATTADQVEVRLRADTNSYIRNLNAADAAFGKVAAGIEQDAARVNAATNKMGLNTANIAAQFQDIGVTAAMGMNPLQIALQQGTQLSAVLNQSVSQGVSPVRALGSAFVQIINPISLATIAAIALGAAVLQGIGSIVPQAESANEAIKRHREALEGIVKGYQGAEDAVAAYFDAASRLPGAIAQDQLRGQFADLAKEVDIFRERASRLGDTFVGFGSAAEQRLGQLSRDFADGVIEADEYYSALQDVKGGLNAVENALGFLPNGIQAIIREMEDGALKSIAFANALNNVVAASHALANLSVDADLKNALDLQGYIAEQERINGLTTEQLQLEKEIARIKSDAGEFGITDSRAAELAQQTLDAEKRRAEIAKQLREGGKSGDKAAREYDRERQAIEDLLESMGFQAALLGQSNREKAIAIALSKANATATEEERQQIAQMAAFIYDTEQAIKELNSSSQEWADTIQNATRGFIDDLIAGKSAAEAFSNVLSNIASKLLDVGLSNLFGGGGFNLASLFGGTPTRATGGPIYPGGPTLVGEKGPELFIPSTPGKIVPNSQIGGGGSVVFAPNIDARGADVAAVARLEQSLQRLAAEVVPTIRKEIANGPKKGRK